jgi:hypothetical protein
MHCEVRNGEASCDRCSINSPLRKKRESWALRATPASELRPPRPRSPWHAHDRPSTAKARATDGTTRTRTASCARQLAAALSPLPTMGQCSPRSRGVSLVCLLPSWLSHRTRSSFLSRWGSSYKKKYQWQWPVLRTDRYTPAACVERIGIPGRSVRQNFNRSNRVHVVRSRSTSTDRRQHRPEPGALRSGRASVDAHHEHDRAARG